VPVSEIASTDVVVAASAGIVALVLALTALHARTVKRQAESAPVVQS
jgi:hypothetical protein